MSLQSPNPYRRRLMLGMFAPWALSAFGCGQSSSGSPGSDWTAWPLFREAQPTVRFPLSISPEGRYFVDAQGSPFLIHGDTAWSIAGQLNDEDIAHYLVDRYAKGVNAILFSAPEAYYTNQRPAYRNADGAPPFDPMTDFSRPVEKYWRRVDRIVDMAHALGMACVVNPAYLGAVGDGWLDAVKTAAAADLYSYGAFLARRYSRGNVIWCLGGDRDSDAGILDHQWNIVRGIRSVRTSDIITCHPLSDVMNSDDAYTYWQGMPGFNCNAIYGNETTGAYVYRLATQAYGRPGPMPFLGFEFAYENEHDIAPATLRRQSYGAILSGACGQFFGNNPLWHFNSKRWTEWHVDGTWKSHLNSVGAIQQQHVRTLFLAYEWWQLLPQEVSPFVVSELGTAASRIYPAIARDGAFAMIYVPGAGVLSIDMSRFSVRQLRLRLYNPANGTYSTSGVAPFPNNGISSFRTTSECVVVLDSAAKSQLTSTATGESTVKE